ncbi:hypothetical protein [Saccharopolyspora gloriosae]|uniref:hypothetical protein n=1 Tax=Saccharopolyspora gloriosae TaxID=455344 RepID=UPI001FB70B64|nr:hypothetical protein [Saccharopolyspora gloriosae]
MGFAEDLVSGPRGRRLCFAAVAGPHLPTTFGIDAARIADFFDELGDGDVDFLASWEESAFLDPLAESVDRARYWQEPDEVDRALALPDVRRALVPTARAIASAPAVQRWFEPIDLGRQFHAEFAHTGPPGTGRAAKALADWRTSTVEDERRARNRPADPAAPFSGFWWSSPTGEVVDSTCAPHGMGPLGLCLVEDDFGPEEAWCRSVRPTGAPRIFEITGPAAWSELAGRYPLEVSLSRRHDWWKVTGRAGRWVIPDWTAVAADYDAVHLTVAGYLTGAGRALPVGEACSVLAGWNPGQTFWLTDVIVVGPAVRWHGDAADLTTWTPAR